MTVPDQAASVGPGLYVTAHRIAGTGPIHTAIQYVDDEGRHEWISAGPKGFSGRLVSGVGADGAKIRMSDRPENNHVVGRITPPQGLTNADYWDLVRSADAAYRDNVDYDLFPERQDSYNSNSYTRGILDATGGTYTAPFGDYYGGDSPLPARRFAPPHLLDTGFVNSLKPQAAPILRRLP